MPGLQGDGIGTKGIQDGRVPWCRRYQYQDRYSQEELPTPQWWSAIYTSLTSPVSSADVSGDDSVTTELLGNMYLQGEVDSEKQQDINHEVELMREGGI